MNEAKFFGMYEYMFQKGAYVNCVGVLYIEGSLKERVQVLETVTCVQK